MTSRVHTSSRVIYPCGVCHRADDELHMTDDVRRQSSTEQLNDFVDVVTYII